MYDASAMVASRKSRKPAPRRHRETLEEKFERLLALPVDSPFPKLTEREARYFARRLWEIGDPAAPSGAEVMRAFYGPCTCETCADDDVADREVPS